MLDFLNPDQRAYVEEHCERKEWKAGEVLFPVGATEKCVYGVLSGEVSVYGRDRYGVERRLIGYGPGRTVGIQAWLEDRPRLYSAVAAKDTVTLRLSSETLTAWLKEKPELMVGLVKGMAISLSHRLRLALVERDYLED